MGALNEKNFENVYFISPYQNQATIDLQLSKNSSTSVIFYELNYIIVEKKDPSKKETKEVINENEDNIQTRDKTIITNTNKEMIINNNQDKNAQEFNQIKELSKVNNNNNTEVNNQADLIIQYPINDINTNQSKIKHIKKEKKVINQDQHFKLIKKKRGRGNIVNTNKPHDSDEIGNATKSLIISCLRDIHTIGKKLAEESKNFDNARFKTLFMPTITKVIKIKDDSEEDIGEKTENLGIYASHDKMRDLFHSKLYIVYTDYTFPKRVEGDFEFQQIDDKYEKIKRKEGLLQKYKEHIKDISNKKSNQNDKFIAFLNLEFVDFLKIYINYDDEKVPKKSIEYNDNISIDLSGFGPKKKIDEKLRAHVKKIISHIAN